jgi:hypothetical protein
MTGRACGRRMAAYPRPRPKIVQGWGEGRGGPRERRNWDALCWSADGDRGRGLPAMLGNRAVWQRAVPRNRMRAIFTSGSVGGLDEESPILPGQLTAYSLRVASASGSS